LSLAGNPNLANYCIYTNTKQRIRAALATLYYSTKGKTSSNNDNWLSNKSVCDKWYQYELLAGGDMAVDCTSDAAVSSIKLSYNNLQEEISPKIGLLFDSLGKFVVEECTVKLYCMTQFAPVTTYSYE
jgi:hypothetical protein